MKIEIKNIDLQKVIVFLSELGFKGIASINRSKVTNYLTGKLDGVAEGEKTIREDYKDDVKKMSEELRAYFDEKVTVGGDEFVKPLNVIKAKIEELTGEDSEEEFSGEQAFTLAVLYDAFEIGGAVK